MPVAAVPSYLQRLVADDNKFRYASPALRFGLLLPIWTARADQEAEVKKMAEAKSKKGDEIRAAIDKHGVEKVIADLVRKEELPGLWEKNDYGARTAWQKVTALSPDDKARMRALADRQKSLWQKIPVSQALRLEAQAIAPFTTGLGNEHPLENGFAFLNPYGLPYLPGSGVKGVLREAARELASGAWDDKRGWNDEPRYDWPLERESGEPPLKLSMFEVLFGRETEEGEQEHFRGALTFWDVIPQIAGDGLLVEIMTPHYSHYYAPGKKQEEIASPHDSGQPNPICFLTVPPGSRFVFHVTCDTLHLARVAPDLAENGRWKQLLEAAFEHAFHWLGFGAKTAVGYGAMKQVGQAAGVTPAEAAAGRRGTSQQTGESAAVRAGTELAQQVWRGATLKFHPPDQSITAVLGNQRTAPLRGQDAKRLLDALGPERAGALRSNKSLSDVNVRIEQVGNMIKLLGLAE